MIGELAVAEAGFNERLSGASPSFELLVLLVVYVGGADIIEPLVECAGNLITSTRSDDSLYSPVSF